jgi:hypothetical protein
MWYINILIKEASFRAEELDKALQSGKNVDAARKSAIEAGRVLLRARTRAIDESRRAAQTVCDALNESDSPDPIWFRLVSLSRDGGREQWQDLRYGGCYWRISASPSRWERIEIRSSSGVFAGHGIVRVPSPGTARWEVVSRPK